MKNFIITSEVKSTITMKEGFELTQEIIDLARGYNVYSCYMDNYTQMKEEEDKNDDILAKLEPLGVERIRRS